jgi:predicted nucleic-acid-binding Zn-ribbon protein
MEQQDAPIQNCPHCGGDSFVWGQLSVFAEVAPIMFIAQDASWLARGFGLGRDKLKARACKQCGYIALFIAK